jgi:hypothetical protein
MIPCSFMESFGRLVGFVMVRDRCEKVCELRAASCELCAKH